LQLASDARHLHPHTVDIGSGIGESPGKNSLVATNPAHIRGATARKNEGRQNHGDRNMRADSQRTIPHQLNNTK
jgi:hypothetical protein